MSKGNPIIKLRVSREKLAEIMSAIDSANVSRREEEYHVSSWIRAAIEEKLAHLKRSKRKKEKRQEDEVGVSETILEMKEESESESPIQYEM